MDEKLTIEMWCFGYPIFGHNMAKQGYFDGFCKDIMWKSLQLVVEPLVLWLYWLVDRVMFYKGIATMDGCHPETSP